MNNIESNVINELNNLKRRRKDEEVKDRQFSDDQNRRDNARKMRVKDGHGGYASYDTMLAENWLNSDAAVEHKRSSDMRICCCVRKRPMFEKEKSQGYFDCLSTKNPTIRIHEPKMKVDGITKYIDTTDFKFDNVYSEHEDTEVL